MLTPVELVRLIVALSQEQDGIPRAFWEPAQAQVLYRPRKWHLERARHLRSYSDVMDFERNADGAFSRARLRPKDAADHPGFHAPWFTDGQTHAAYRKVAKPPFHEGRLQDYEDMIREVAWDRVQRVKLESGGSFDLGRDLTQPFALEVIGRILGAHGAEIRAFWDHLAAITEFENMNTYPDAGSLTSDLDRIIDRQVTRPQGALGEVAQRLQRLDAPPILLEHGARQILRGYGMAGFFAGTDTLAMTILNSFLEAQRRHLYNELVALALAGDLDEMMAMMEELMRVLPAFPASAAVTDKAVTLRSGLRLREGETIVAWFTSANRDPAEFEDPLSVRPGREGIPLIYGWYSHYCWGAPLARLEMRILLPMMLAELPNLRPQPGAERVRRTGRVNRLTSDPYVFD